MKDQWGQLMDDALPSGPVPFVVDAAQIAGMGRRVRKRRQRLALSGVTVGVVTLVTGLLLWSPLSFGTQPDPTSPGGDAKADTITPRNAPDVWGESDFNGVEKTPFTNDSSAALAQGFVSAMQQIAPELTVSGDGPNGVVEFGRYTLVFDEGADLDVMVAFGSFASDAANLPTTYNVTIFDAAADAAPKDFVNCDFEGVSCQYRTGPGNEDILMGTRIQDFDGLEYVSYNVLIKRPDNSIVELMVAPSLDGVPEGSLTGTVEPLLHKNMLKELALKLPQDLKL